MEPLLSALEDSAFAAAFRGYVWLHPAVEVVHIAGFVILAGAAFVLDLRLLGRFRALPLHGSIRALGRWARFGLVLAALSGVTLFVVDATALATNPAFRLKLVLLVAAGLNAALFHRLVLPRLAGPDDAGHFGGQALPLAARLAGALSIALWLAVIASGRLIAYV